MAKAGGNLLNTYVADYVVFDLETTGISPKTDEVVEISAVKVEHGKVTDEFSTLVNPKQRIPYGASRVNGITDDMVAEAPFFEQVLEEFLEFIEGFVLVGHNIARFDMNFLYRDVEKYFERSLPNDYIDTLQMARRELPNLEHHRLTDLAEYYGISAEGAHRALNDCRMNQQVFEKMGNPVYKKQGKDKENNRGVDSAKTEPSEQAQNTAPTVRKRSTFKLRAVVERITSASSGWLYGSEVCGEKLSGSGDGGRQSSGCQCWFGASDRRKLENGQSLWQTVSGKDLGRDDAGDCFWH